MAAGMGFYAWQIEPHWVEIVRHRLPIAGLPAELVGKRLVHLSDIHAGPRVDQTYPINSAESIAELRPDMIVVTGDMMSCRDSENISKVLDVFNAMPAMLLGKFAVPGNHDYGQGWRQWRSVRELGERLERIDVRLLQNEVAEVEGLQIAGLDDLWAGHIDPEGTLAELDPAAPTLALVHNPDAVDLPAWRSFQGWILAGHTHGGQCKAPFFRPTILPVKNKRYVAGPYDLAPGRNVYINRGLGHLEQVRFNCRPEITLFTLEQA